MKRAIIAALVGGIIMFLWQFVSWNLANLHQPAQRYTPKQEAIMSHLNSLNLEEGGYILPMPPPGASMEEWNKAVDASVGKPWAKVEYHSALTNNMTLNMIRGLVTNFFTILLLCWLLMQFKTPGFSSILTASLFTGLIVFFNAPYTNYIWYEGFDIWGHLADAVISWALVGLWLGWYLKRSRGKNTILSHSRRSAVFNID